MYNWRRIKNYTLQEYLFDIKIPGFNEVKWRLFIDFIKTSKNLLTVNFYNPITDKNYEFYDDMIYELISLSGFNFSINLEYGEMELHCMFSVMEELDININTDAIKSETDFLELKDIIEKICKETNSLYYKITPEMEDSVIIYENSL